MHFNNKYINLGDSEDVIKDKINYNFNQILSFAVGQEGLIGPKGATGIPGPSGKRGNTGPTGDRATNWTRGTTFPPPSSTQEFDLWIDDSSGVGDVYERGSTSGSWVYTGFSLYGSNYFELYTSIVGPIGSTDKSAIGFKSNLISNSTSLVISDSVFSSSDINPNNSKLLISTEDQITNPILSFVKSNGDTSISPNFRWKNAGSSSYLIFDLPGEFNLISLLDLSISSFETAAGGDFFFRGTGSLLGNTNGGIFFDSPFEIKFESINPFVFSSLNFGIGTSEIYSNNLTEISNLSTNLSPAYSLASIPNPASSPIFNYRSGIRVNSDSEDYRVFDFTGIGGYSVLYGLPSGEVSSGNHKQTVFGVTGGSSGSTGAPYSYHIKRIKSLTGKLIKNSLKFYPYSSRNSNPISGDSVKTNVIDLTDQSKWDSNLIVFTTSSSNLTGDVYLYVPSSPLDTLDPLYYSSEGTEYRVYLNEEASSPTRLIKGICYDYWFYLGTSVSVRRIFIDLPSPCPYVDFFWAFKGSNTNPNGRIFYKTCSGSSGFLEMTNSYPISGNSEFNPASIPSGSPSS